MMRKVVLRRLSATLPKLVVAGKHPIVTWNTGGIDQLSTRKERGVQHVDAGTRLLAAACVLCVVVMVAATLFGVWLLGQALR